MRSNGLSGVLRRSALAAAIAVASSATPMLVTAQSGTGTGGAGGTGGTGTTGGDASQTGVYGDTGNNDGNNYGWVGLLGLAGLLGLRKRDTSHTHVGTTGMGSTSGSGASSTGTRM